MYCRQEYFSKCPAKVNIKICGAYEETVSGVIFLAGVSVNADKPLGTLNVRFYNDNPVLAFVNLAGGELGYCPGFRIVFPYDYVDGKIDFGDAKGVLTYLAAVLEPERDLDGRYLRFRIEFWSSRFSPASCTISSTEPASLPYVKFTYFYIPSRIRYGQDLEFNVVARLEKCTVVDLVVGIRKDSGPGRVYWRKRDGYWHEVPWYYTYDTITSGVLKPGVEGVYSGKLRFEKPGTYTLTFCVGFGDYPSIEQLYLAGVLTSDIVDLLRRRQVMLFTKPIRKMGITQVITARVKVD